MLRRTVSGIMLTILSIGMLTLAFNVPLGFALTRKIIVPDDYPTIQEAINAANPGDTVYVRAGTYYENVIVNKTIALIGENRSTTIIDGGGTRHVISLMADNVNISGFTIRNSGSRYADDSGVHLVGHDHNNVSGNMFTDTLVSIYLEHSHNNMISDNVIVATRQWYSIWLRYSHSNIVESNLVTNNSGSGICLWSSNANTVDGNDVTGISTLETANGMGIGLHEGSHSNIIRNNILVDNRYCGVCLMKAEDNTIQGNVMKCNYLGIYSWKSNNNIIENTILKNDWHGINLYQSNGSIIYHNNFINNTISSEGINTWDNGYPSGGNYWSYYNGADLYSGPYQNETGGDGIGDAPYIIDVNNQDNYPLMVPYDPTIVNFRVLYYELLEKYNVLLEDYRKLNLTYHELLDSYSTLLSDFGALNATYYELLADYDNLQASHDSLNSTYNNLVSDYDNLQSSYNQLNSSYTSLQDSYNELQSDREAIINELNSIRNLTYIFITTTIILTAATVYFMKRKARGAEREQKERRK